MRVADGGTASHRRLLQNDDLASHSFQRLPRFAGDGNESTTAEAKMGRVEVRTQYEFWLLFRPRRSGLKCFGKRGGG